MGILSVLCDTIACGLSGLGKEQTDITCGGEACVVPLLAPHELSCIEDRSLRSIRVE